MRLFIYIFFENDLGCYKLSQVSAQCTETGEIFYNPLQTGFCICILGWGLQFSYLRFCAIISVTIKKCRKNLKIPPHSILIQ